MERESLHFPPRYRVMLEPFHRCEMRREGREIKSISIFDPKNQLLVSGEVKPNGNTEVRTYDFGVFDEDVFDFIRHWKKGRFRNRAGDRVLGGMYDRRIFRRQRKTATFIKFNRDGHLEAINVYSQTGKFRLRFNFSPDGVLQRIIDFRRFAKRYKIILNFGGCEVFVRNVVSKRTFSREMPHTDLRKRKYQTSADPHYPVHFLLTDETKKTLEHAGIDVVDLLHSLDLVEVPSINYHLFEPCNMRCKYCFATFQDIKAILPKGHLSREDSIALITKIAESGFRKLTFAGGEPLLCGWLAELIQVAKQNGMTTMVVTNGLGVDQRWLDSVKGYLDWVTLSIDSANEETHSKLGRAYRGTEPIPSGQYVQVAKNIKASGIRLKLNTVVTKLNHMEDMRDFVKNIGPERWKIFQVLPINGQNDGKVEELVIPKFEYDKFIARHADLQYSGIVVVPEPNDLMTGSYFMVDPAGRFYDNVDGKHHYSSPILEKGVFDAMRETRINPEKFVKRMGLYDFDT